MILPTTADTTRHISTVWKGEKPWHWKALYRGHSQPRGYRSYWHNRHRWQLHLTPIHLSRDGEKWTAGLCFGKRTIYLASHR